MTWCRDPSKGNSTSRSEHIHIRNVSCEQVNGSVERKLLFPVEAGEMGGMLL
jgi:hypothetical protein